MVRGFLCLLISLSMVISVYSEEAENPELVLLRGNVIEEAPGELVNLKLGDASVSFRMAGRWKGSLEAGWGLAFAPLGVSALSSETPFFTQEGDLTLSLWIENRWFVEANFMDNSSLNTYRAGYQGQARDIVKYAGIGNTGLNFPAFPYLDLGGDSPSSFGAYGHFETGSLSFHSMVRYDAAAREERVFVGNRERTFSYGDLSKPQRGISFVLPDENLDTQPVIFIHDNQGDLTDSEGRRWRRALPSEYSVSARLGLVELSLGSYTGGIAEPDGMIAVYYPGASYPSLGNYGTANPENPGSGGGTGFLGEVQEYFDNSGFAVNLAAYPQCGAAINAPGTIFITDLHIDALVIYEPGTFSPFERQNRYQSPASSVTQAALVKLSTGELISGFEIIPPEETSDRETFQTRSGVYELIREGSKNRRSPEERWPLGGQNRDGNSFPQLYVPVNTPFTGDAGLRFTVYSAAGAFSIGSDIIPDSVQVYRNGIPDPNFSFSGGNVILHNPAAFSETIRITYLKQSYERRLGSLAAGIGVIWDPPGPFGGKLGLGLRWNTSSGSYSETGASSAGTAGLGAEAKWAFEHVQASLGLGFGFEQPDVTGLYRIAGMEGNEIVLSLSPGNSFIAPPPSSYNLEERAGLVYRNHRETNLLGASSLTDVSANAAIVSGLNGPYPASDEHLTSQVLVAEFEFAPGKAWTGFQVPLGLNGEYLARAGKIEIPYRFFDFSGGNPAAEISVKLQIGMLADESSVIFDHHTFLLEKKLYPDSAQGNLNSAGFHENGRIAVFLLNDDDRIKLQNAKYLRVLIERSPGGTDTLRGRFILAPPIVRGTLFRPVIASNEKIIPSSIPAITVFEDTDTGKDSLANKVPDLMERLHGADTRQRILAISWESFSSTTLGQLPDMGPGVDTRLSSIPLDNYRSLSFFIQPPRNRNDSGLIDNGYIRFIIARGPLSVNRKEETALEAIIPLRAFENTSPWARVDILYRGEDSQVLVEGKPVPLSTVWYNSAALSGFGTDSVTAFDPAGARRDQWKSDYLAIFLVPDPGAFFGEGSMALDEIFLEDPVASFRLNGGASFEWKVPGDILMIGNVNVISGFEFHSSIESGFHNGSVGFNGRSGAEVSILGFRLSGNYFYFLKAANGSGADYNWAAAHGISRSFGPFYFSGLFNNSPADNIMNHGIIFALRTRVRANLSGDIAYDDGRLGRLWRAGAGGRPAEKFPLDFTLDLSAHINEKKDNVELDLGNYAAAWLDSSKSMLIDSGAEAESRDSRGSFSLRLDTQPVGAELYFQGTASYSGKKDNSAAASLARFDIPFIKKEIDLRMLFRLERSYRRDLVWVNADTPEILPLSSGFLDDTKIWAGSFTDAAALLFSVPFYSFFDSGMSRYMSEFSTVSQGEIAGDPYLESGFFSDRFEYSLQRAMSYGLSSFIIPRFFSFQISRNLDRKLDIQRDTLVLGAGLNFLSINMFGAMGIFPLFMFYMGDEFSHSLETRISIPRGETIAWSVRANQSAVFYGFSGAELSLENTFRIQTANRLNEGNQWGDSLSVAWIVPVEKSLLGSLYEMMAKGVKTQSSWLTLANLADAEYDLLRRESLEFIIEKNPSAANENNLRFSFVLRHESSVRIFGRLNFSVFTKLKLTEDFSTRIFSFMGSVGTTMNLIF